MSFFNYKVQGQVICENKLYTTIALNEMINKIKCYLLSNPYSDKIIAIAMPRSIYLLSSVLALLECKITYLLIDVDLQPKKRIDYILDDAEIDTILSISSFEFESDNKNIVFVDKIKGREKDICLCSGSSLAYLLYTSGTTGTPKGVEISRESLNNFITGITNIIKFSSADKIISLTSPSFDIFFLEAILPLYFGATVIFASSEEIHNPQKIIGLFNKYNINILQITPSRLRLLSTIDKELTFLNNINTIMIGGEVFPEELLDKLKMKLNMKIYNMYGPTETTIWSTVADLTDCDFIHLGKPICNTEIYLLDDNLYDVKSGVNGEICISGAGLANGYHNDDESTKSHFRKLPQTNKIVYRTGDIGVLDENGYLLYVGRRDNQIKYHGHRIELEEIEHYIISFKSINSVAVCYDEQEDDLLVFYSSDRVTERDIIIAYLKKYLPDYMIPFKYIHVKDFIYTSSGKIDKNKMLKQYRKSNIKIETCKMTKYYGVDTIIINCISKILNTSNDLINFDASFSDLGFDSISYVEFIVSLETELKIDFEESVLAIDNFETIRKLSEYIKNK